MKKNNLLFYFLLTLCPLVSSCPNDSDDEIGPDKIAFSALDGNFYQIYLTNPQGSKVRKLGPFRNNHCNFPRWSPNGEEIAFNVGVVYPHGPSIYLMNSDGSSPHSPNQNVGLPGLYPRWSPDGKKIVFDDPTYLTNSSFVYDLDSNKITYSIDALNMVWSPDGNKIAYQRSDYDSSAHAYISGLFISNLDGQNRRQLTTELIQYPEWKPDGNAIIFSDGTNGKIVNLPDSSLDTLVFSGELENICGPFSWSHDGSKLLYISMHKNNSNKYLNILDLVTQSRVRVLEDSTVSSADWLK